MEENKGRPELLTVLCILTFIGSGISMLANGILFLVFDQVREIFSQEEGYSFLGSEIDFSFLANISNWFFLSMGLAQALSFTGAYEMFKLKKRGFHLYAIAQITLLILPKLFIPSLPFPLFELMISAIFILLYYKNLQYMS
jgi:hypothetical protein